jgi:hypothetical protein
MVMKYNGRKERKEGRKGMDKKGMDCFKSKWNGLAAIFD